MAKVNSITKDFNSRVQALLSDGFEVEDIVTKLAWSSSPFSLVRNCKRNVPQDVYERFNVLFKIENSPEVSYTKTLEQKYIQRLEDDLIALNDHNLALKDSIQVKLDRIEDNQLVLLALLESTVKSFSEKLFPGSQEEKKEARSDLSKDAIRRLTVHRRKGKYLEVNTEDIIEA